MATTYRHNKLYNQAINIMKMGDANVESYDVAMKKMIELVPAIASVRKVRDDMSLEDRENNLIARMVGSRADQASVGIVTSNVPQQILGFGDPSKKRPVGQPSTGRDKPPDEQLIKRSRFCSIC